MKAFFTKIVCTAALACSLVLLPSLSQAADNIKVSGSTTVLPLAQKAAEVYMRFKPEVRISVAGTGSGDGIKAIIDGSTDIGNSSRELKPKEVKLAASKGIKVQRHVVAMDCIVPVVHPSNPVKDLTMAQLRDIYIGKIKRWNQVGGLDKPIVVVSRDSSSGTFEVWRAKVLAKARVRPDAQLQASNGAVGQAVAGNKYAIGYVGLGYLNDSLKPLTVGGVKGDLTTARDGSYPVARGLNMFTRAQPSVAVKAFLEFILSPRGQKIAAQEGFVPIK